MTDNKHIARLWQQYIAGKASSAELEELFAYIDNTGNDDENIRLFQEQMQELNNQPVYSAFQAESWEKVSAFIRSFWPVHRVHFLRKWYWAAASIILLSAIGADFWINSTKRTAPDTKAQSVHNDVAPGGNKAMLQLADGSTIVLDSVANGSLAMQGNTKIVKLAGGQIAYSNNGAVGTDILYNRMSTPRGGQYQLTLPDGSKVWLNAASSIRYPTAFTGKERKVEVTGEAYFEIARNTAMPFRVVTAGAMEIEVLGTHFNVNAYDDEPLGRTTLLEGSVRVKLQHVPASVMLKPGEQAQAGLNRQSDRLAVQAVNVEQAVAWKNGIFNFNRLKLDEVMRQVSRWYDVEVVYKSKIPDMEFGGKMDRNLQLSELLEGLEEIGIHCTIEKGRRLIVLP